MSTILPVPGPAVVMDASIIAKYMLPDETADQVHTMLPQDADYIAPSIIEFEICSLLCKHIRLGRLTRKIANEALDSWADAIDNEWIWIVPTQNYINDTFELAGEIKHAFYDCCYLALARQDNTTLITADRQLYERGKAVHSDIILVA